MTRPFALSSFVRRTGMRECHKKGTLALNDYTIDIKGGALFVAPPPSPFDSPATSYKLALGGP
jgi:hypothetical protein